MTQKQLQGDWEKKPNSGTIISFLAQGIDSGKCCVILQTSKNFQNNPSKRERAGLRDMDPQIKLSSLINCEAAALFHAFRPLTRRHFDPLPPQWLKLLPRTSGAESATQAPPNDKYCEYCGAACGINASCRGRVNRCLEVATADKTANLVMHNDRCAVSPHTNVAYRYANTFSLTFA